jgi:hypothetical protein
VEFTSLHHSNEKSARSQTRSGTAFPRQRLLTFASTAAKAPLGGAPKAIHPAPSGFLLVWRKGDEGIEIPRRDNARV